MTLARARAACFAVAWAAGTAHAQRDMMGPDGIALLRALPHLMLAAIGELAVAATLLFAVLALFAWLSARVGRPRPRGVPTAGTLVVLALVAAVPAGLYLAFAPEEPSNDPVRAYRSWTIPDRKVDPLPPPAGTAWPRATGYLALPQGAQGGHGVIRVSGAHMHPVYVKLCAAGEAACPGLRHAFVARMGSFAFRDLPPGAYEVRWLPVDRPTVGGRSRTITVTPHVEDEHAVTIVDSPVFESRGPVAAIAAKDF